jgi:putative hydrolase
MLELSSRKGHCLANGHVAKIAYEVGANIILDTDAHSPNDLISYKTAYKIASGAGLVEKQILEVLEDNPNRLLKRKVKN